MPKKPCCLQMHNLISILVFLFGALTFLVPSGYSWGPAGLLVISLIACTYSSWYWKTLKNQEHWVIIIPFLLFFIAALSEVFLHESDIRVLDKPSRFLYLALILPLLIKFPPKPSYVWLGISIGAITAGGWGIQQTVIDNLARAQGNTQGIQFGNISILYSFLSLCGLLWLLETKSESRTLFLLMTFGIIGGVLGSILSGSRGGWLSLPLCVAIISIFFWQHINRKQLKRLFAVFVLTAVCAVSIGSDMISQRTNKAVSELAMYVESRDSTTSVGARIELWKASWLLGKEKPFTGWGTDRVGQGLGELVEMQAVNSSVLNHVHAHNDYFNLLQLQGVLGLSALLLLYFLPAAHFARQIKIQSLKSIPLSGLITCISYAVFSLTQAFLEHNSGVMVYAMLLTTFYCLGRNAATKPKQSIPDSLSIKSSE